jgi:hypothetical protein
MKEEGKRIRERKILRRKKGSKKRDKNELEFSV